MKVIFFGLGSIGSRHARILKNGFDHELYAYRSRHSQDKNRLGVEEVYSWKQVKRVSPDVAFITNPTYLHVGTAIKCASLGMHLFIEKPLSDKIGRIDSLESLCRRKKLTCYTAYCLRFHPVIKKIRGLITGKRIYHARVICSSYLPAWRKNRDLKKSYSAFSRRGGGVLLDLSHEFDYIEYLFGRISRMRGAYGKVSDVTLDAEDFSDILISLENSIQVNLHLDYFGLSNERRVEIDFKGGYILGDLTKGKVVYEHNGRKMVTRFNVNRDRYLKEQAEYFFDNIGNPVIMNNPGEAGSLLAKIVRFKNGKRKDIGDYRGARWFAGRQG